MSVFGQVVKQLEAAKFTKFGAVSNNKFGNVISNGRVVYITLSFSAYPSDIDVEALRQFLNCRKWDITLIRRRNNQIIITANVLSHFSINDIKNSINTTLAAIGIFPNNTEIETGLSVPIFVTDAPTPRQLNNCSYKGRNWTTQVTDAFTGKKPVINNIKPEMVELVRNENGNIDINALIEAMKNAAPSSSFLDSFGKSLGISTTIAATVLIIGAVVVLKR